MAKNTIINYTNAGAFVSKQGTAAVQTLLTVAGNGSKILSLYVTGAAATAYNINVTISGLTQTALLISATTDANGIFDILAAMPLPKTAAGTKYMNLESGAVISVAHPIAVYTAVYYENY